MASQITGVSIVCSKLVQVQIKETSNLHVAGLCQGNAPVTGEFPAQRASKPNTENVSIWIDDVIMDDHLNIVKCFGTHML